MPVSFLNPRHYSEFVRLMVFLALLFSHWPLVLLEIYAEGYGFRGIWIRCRQELAILRGATEGEASERHRV